MDRVCFCLHCETVKIENCFHSRTKSSKFGVSLIISNKIVFERVKIHKMSSHEYKSALRKLEPQTAARDCLLKVSKRLWRSYKHSSICTINIFIG